MKKIRVAIIGGGHLGQIHTRLMKQNPAASVAAVCDPQPLVQQKFIQQFDVRAVSDFRKIIDQIDAAIVATPTSLHHSISAELLSAGIHLLIEKPVTSNLAQARELLELAESNQCIVQVGHVERFNPAIQTALRLVGKPKFIEARRMSGFTFRSTDIGAVLDLMIHDIDLAQWIFHDTPNEIRAVGVSVLGSSEDISQARLQFPCGAVANLTASRCSYVAERSWNIFGSEGFAQVDLTSGRVQVVQIPAWIRRREIDLVDASPEQQQFVRENLFSQILPKSELVVEPANAIALEQKDWLAAIKSHTLPTVPLVDGVKAVGTAEQILNQMANHDWQLNEALMNSDASSLNKRPEALEQRPDLFSAGPARRAA